MFAPSPSAQTFVTTSLREQLQATLEGSYTLGRELGGGGMSRVFVAEETTLGRRVVVKVLAPELTEGMSAERFAREVRVAARLQHPNIVPLLAAGERDGLAYYTMPYVEGESLRARLSREGRLSIDVAVSVLRDVARALEYAHEHGVVHRDIKPENILLTHGAASVADFGIAKALHVARTAAPSGAGDVETTGPRATDETLTRLGSSLGTPAYMAPEQAAGDPDVDARADVYAWGVVAYELLAGAPPFAGRTAHALVMAHIGEPPPPLGDRARGCTAGAHRPGHALPRERSGAATTVGRRAARGARSRPHAVRPAAALEHLDAWPPDARRRRRGRDSDSRRSRHRRDGCLARAPLRRVRTAGARGVAIREPGAPRRRLLRRRFDRRGTQSPRGGRRPARDRRHQRAAVQGHDEVCQRDRA